MGNAPSLTAINKPSPFHNAPIAAKGKRNQSQPCYKSNQNQVLHKIEPGSGLENHHSLRHGGLQDLTLVL
jgi:hypothetical protein